MHLLAERFVFWRWWSGLSKRGSQDLSNGTNVLSRQCLFCIFTSIVYGTLFQQNLLALTPHAGAKGRGVVHCTHQSIWAHHERVHVSTTTYNNDIQKNTGMSHLLFWEEWGSCCIRDQRKKTNLCVEQLPRASHRPQKSSYRATFYLQQITWIARVSTPQITRKLLRK
jgi:hypothetical protein